MRVLRIGNRLILSFNSFEFNRFIQSTGKALFIRRNNFLKKCTKVYSKFPQQFFTLP